MNHNPPDDVKLGDIKVSVYSRRRFAVGLRYGYHLVDKRTNTILQSGEPNHRTKKIAKQRGKDVLEVAILDLKNKGHVG